MTKPNMIKGIKPGFVLFSEYIHFTIGGSPYIPPCIISTELRLYLLSNLPSRDLKQTIVTYYNQRQYETKK